MNVNWHDTARKTLEGAESGAQTFAEGARMLMEAGFDGYAVDFRCSTRTYYMPDGQTITLKTATAEAVAERFDATAIKVAISEAQAMAPGYTYKGFCAKVTRAGCAGYAVSLLGKRVLYYGRTGEAHTEYFPGTRPSATP